MKEQPPAKNDAVSPNRVLKAVLKTPHSKRWRENGGFELHLSVLSGYLNWFIGLKCSRGYQRVLKGT